MRFIAAPAVSRWILTDHQMGVGQRSTLRHPLGGGDLLTTILGCFTPLASCSPAWVRGRRTKHVLGMGSSSQECSKQTYAGCFHSSPVSTSKELCTVFQLHVREVFGEPATPCISVLHSKTRVKVLLAVHSKAFHFLIKVPRSDSRPALSTTLSPALQRVALASGQC